MAHCENCEMEGNGGNCHGGEHSCYEDGGTDNPCGKPARIKINYELDGETWHFWVCVDCYDKYYADDEF